MNLGQWWPTSKTAVSDAAPFKQDDTSSIDPIDDYLALGSIRLVGSSHDTDVNWLMVGSQGGTAYPNPLLSLAEKRQWIKIRYRRHPANSHHALLRIYALPEDVKRSSRGSIKDLRKVLRFLAAYVDISAETWAGNYDTMSPIRTYTAPISSQEESLFYIFNTLSSPRPSRDGAGNCPYSQQSLSDIFEDSVDGLKTSLYPYQKRSVAAMLQKEANPAKTLDPRKPMFRDLHGQAFYFDALEGVLLVNPCYYSEPQGGILAETMGYGKTLICITLILATRGHYPKVPEGRLHTVDGQNTEQTPSLLELAAKTVKHTGVPWKSQFARLTREGYHFDRCTEAIQKYDAEFAEPIFHPTTPNRRGKKREDFRVLRLCSSTLLIVPPNLLIQWRHEIERHTHQDALDVLVLDLSTKEIPHYTILMNYDIVLITKARFDQEYRDDDLNQGKRLHGQDKFRSQLTEVRWLRVICDEGHSFAGSSYRTHAMAMLDKMSIERRWVVSGTPSHSLHGVDVNLAVDENSQGAQLSRTDSIQKVLQHRKIKDTAAEEIKDIERLRVIVVKFLKQQPWANQKGSDHAEWKTYLAPFDASGKRRSAPGLRVILQSLIVRHRIEDIDVDLCLPPLHNTTVYLEPSYYDKLSMNLFRMELTSNAVTSERIDEDYMFHPRNRKFLDELISNLRHSSFHWVAFTQDRVTETIRVSGTYLGQNIDTISDDDGRLLTEAIMAGERALKDAAWCAFSFFHDIGVYIEGFPEHAAHAWALHGQETSPLLLGTVQAREAQQYVLKNLDSEDPTAGLAGAGLRAMQAARSRAVQEQQARDRKVASSNAKAPPAGTGEGPKVKNQSTASSIPPSSSNHQPPSAQKRPPQASNTPLPASLAKTRILGFTSAKLNYLCSRILSLHQSEKIIIFYDLNNIAFWIAEALELLSVKFLIYANTLSVGRRAAYLATFNQSETFRVLLMDLKQASHGLHVAAASRVFIVSPIWQPGVESQAIKRAHRIGQTRPVYVETLVLRGTLEEKMLKRRGQMSNAELVRAEKSLLDDGTMNGIVRSDQFLKIADGEDKEICGRGLHEPIPLFERRGDASRESLEGRTEDGGHGGHGGGDDDLILGLDDAHVQKKPKRATRKDKADVFTGPGTSKATSFWASRQPEWTPSSAAGIVQKEKLKKSVRIAVEGPSEARQAAVAESSRDPGAGAGVSDVV